MQGFEELKVWQKARMIANEVETLIREGKFEKNYPLMDQLRRSSGSAMDNIAEGSERGGNKEFKNFLGMAKGSIGETRSQLYRGLDGGYINENEFEKMKSECIELSKMLGSFINYLKTSEFKGQKFYEPVEEYGSRNLEP